MENKKNIKESYQFVIMGEHPGDGMVVIASDFREAVIRWIGIEWDLDLVRATEMYDESPDYEIVSENRRMYGDYQVTRIVSDKSPTLEVPQ